MYVIEYRLCLEEGQDQGSSCDDQATYQRATIRAPGLSTPDGWTVGGGLRWALGGTTRIGFQINTAIVAVTVRFGSGSDHQAGPLWAVVGVGCWILQNRPRWVHL